MSEIDTVLAELAALHPKLIDLGLDRTFDILKKLGNPHESLPPVIHIAGTNGKGSTAAFLRAMANEAGLRCHVYSSPHLCRFHERIRLADKLISDAELAALLKEVRDKNAGEPITFFEVTTAAAFLAFSRVPADLVILETGLGGLLDSTNVIAQPAATIITPIARDHEHFLGSDITEIARQKAGIFKTGSPAIIAAQSDEAKRGLIDIATQKEVTCHWMGDAFHYSKQADGSFTLTTDHGTVNAPPPSLAGNHQYDNAACAAAAILGPLDRAIAGVAKAKWPGRVQKLDAGRLINITGGTPIWLDGAHNAHGAEALVKTMSDKQWCVIIGALNTRPIEDFIAQIAPMAARIIAVTIPQQEAALSASEISEAADKYGIAAMTAPTLQAAVTLAQNEPHILICGSLYLAGHVLDENGTLPD